MKHYRYRSWFFYLFLTAFYAFQAPAGVGAADDKLVIDAVRQFEYARQLMTDKDFLGAVEEFKRFIHFFPEDPRTVQAQFLIGMAYFHHGSYTDAVAAFERVISEKGFEWPALQAHLMAAESRRRQGAFGQAVITLQNVIAMSDDTDTLDEAYYRLGWIYVETGSWLSAQAAFAKIQNKQHYRVDEMTGALNQAESIPSKDPALAGLLSIVPGAGQLYCGRHRDARVAFLVNAGLILSAYEAFDNDLNVLGGVLSFVGFGFYSGNIYSAVNSARKYNRRQKENFIHQLKNRWELRISRNDAWDPNKPNIVLSFTYRF